MSNVRPLSPAMANLLNTAIQHQNAGQFAQAEALYQLVLQALPNQPEALRLYGLLQLDQGNAQRATELLDRAVKFMPDDVQARIDLAKAYSAMGDSVSAEASLVDATRLDTKCPEARLNLCRIALQNGQLDEAITRYQNLLLDFPDAAIAHGELGEVFVRKNDFDSAVLHLKELVRQAPSDANAHSLLGSVLTSIGQIKEAAAHLERAVSLDPRNVDAFANLGATLMCDPKQLEAAQRAIETAIRLAPNDADLHSNLGAVYNLRNQPSLAVVSFRKAIALNPADASPYSNLLFTLQHMPEQTDIDVFQEHLRFAERFETPLRGKWPSHSRAATRPDRLRIGYVSGDFRDHAVFHFIEPILGHHDHSRFEIFCYHNHPSRDEFTNALVSLSDNWMDCHGLSDDALSAKIFADQVDILIDLSGHTSGNRLLTFARKPAPVQMTWIGYPGTTGLSAMDYRITDHCLDPVGVSDQFHTETLLRIGQHSAPFSPATDSPDVNALPCLLGSPFTFGCLNSARKITPRIIEVWSRILLAVPGSRLVLSSDDAALQNRIRQEFASAGVTEYRVAFLPWAPLSGFLAHHHQIDLGLDPFPYNGGTTSLHALWMGVPFVTLTGTRTASRVGAAVLTRASLPSLIANNEDEYIRIAVSTANDLSKLSQMRKELRARLLAGAEADAAAVTTALETALCEAWDRYTAC
jgi:protein O-GlcNAc transferase